MATTASVHTLTAVEAVPASGPGALAGFEATCLTCGLVIRSSLRTIIDLDVVDHVNYFIREDARRAKATRKARKAQPTCSGCAVCDPAIAAAEAARDEEVWASFEF